MKKITFLKCTTILGLFFLGFSSLYAQNPISVDAKSLYKHTTNSTDLTGPVAFEATDSVTVGGKSVYYVMPDANVNASFNSATDLFLNVTSTFGWTITGVPTGTVSAVATHATATQYKEISWTGKGLGTLQVIESTASCAGSITSIPVMVIDVPKVTGVNFSAISCPTGAVPYTLAGPTATLVITSDVAIGHRDIEVNYSLTGPAGFANIASTLAIVNEGTTIDLTTVNLNQPGIYTLKIISMTDRISRKSGVVSLLNNDYTFTVNRAPVTGKIYHVPNN